MPFRFVHTADLHLDSPLRSLALKNPELAELVRGATRKALEAIVDLCLAEAVDALLVAGDLYDGSQTSMNTALYLSGELRRLEQAGIRVFLIRGNHDSQSTIKKELTLPANVHLFSGRVKPMLAKILDSGREVYIHGVGFDNPHAPDSLLSSFQAPVVDAVNIGMLHTSLAGAPGHDPYAPCSVAELARHGFDYWALGHVHQRQVHSLKPLIVMPGMPQGRDINEAGGKTVTLVSVTDDGQLTAEERAIGQAVFERLTIDLSDLAEWALMIEAAGQAIAAIRQATGAEQLILRLHLVGTTPLAWKLRRDPEFLQAEITNLAAGHPGCWIEKVEVSCAAPGTETARGGPDPVEEVADLVRADVLSSFSFRQQIGETVKELMAQLPREVRERLEKDEAAIEALLTRVGREGSDDVLARLHGTSQAEGLR
ncbi:serine/threonine protein phosphatase [Rhizobium sp. 58]|nr:serine/threonine protein phosphatase [Rhizobium sp. 58]